MKRAFVSATILSLLFVSPVLHGETEPADQAALKAHLVGLEKQSWEAWKNRDGKFFENFLSDDHVEVGFTGRAGKAEIVAFVGSAACQVKSYQLDDFRLQMLSSETALLTYRENQDTVCHAKVPSPCWVSSLYVKRGERWLNALYQQTPIAK